MKKQFHLTQQGVDELKTELATLIGLRSEIANRIKIAREFGDLSENMEYSAARQDQDRHESRISEIEYIVANAKIIKEPKTDGKVVLGSTVLLMSGDGQSKKFQVVGTVEADPLEGKISDESPIGMQLMGKKKGEKIELKLSKPITYTVTDIS